jgi:hypothetical protein
MNSLTPTPSQRERALLEIKKIMIKLLIKDKIIKSSLLERI